MRIFRRIIRTIATVAVIITASVAVVPTTFATTLSVANDYPSTLETSQVANHTLFFTTPTNITEGSTLTLTFASAFDTSSLVEDDIDLADDGVDLTTAADCSGSEKASVAIAADVVTLTVCVGDGGTIAASSIVTVEIGTNATSSGTGANKITNPSTAGDYFVSIAGTFGGSGSIILPIGGDDSIEVTANVPSSGGGGEQRSGGGGSVDTTAPVISQILVSGLTTAEATISWVTNEPATQALSYGLTSSLELGTKSTSSYFSSYAVTLDELTQGTTYYFQIFASDSSGNDGVSSLVTFTTLDETSPLISDIQVLDITTVSARVIWTTNEPANSVVSYGTTTTYSNTVSENSFVTAHSVVLTGLNPATRYHFQVLSTDSSLNQAFSSDGTFTTDTDAPPANVSGLAATPADAQIVLSWINPTDEDLSGIRVLQCVNGYPTGPADVTCDIIGNSLETSLIQTDLSNGTVYYFGVFAYDQSGQFASGALVSATPSASEEEVPLPEPPEEIPPEEPPLTQSEQTEPSGSGSTGTEFPQGSAVSCGDALCSDTESNGSCPQDCGEPPEEPTPLGEGEGIFSQVDLRYFVADGSIALKTTSSGVVDVLPTSTVRAAIPRSVLSDNVKTVFFTVGSDTYLMRLDDALALYVSDLTIPIMSGVLDVTVLVTFKDASTHSVSSYLNAVVPGFVSQVIDGEEAPVSSAILSLFERADGEFVVWDGSPYAQFNPTHTTSDGFFGWYVPNGTYVVRAQSDGYEPSQTEALIVRNNIVNPHLFLALITQEQEEDLQQPVTAPVTEESPPSSVQATLGASLESVQEILTVIREVPGVEEAAEISLPALAIVATTSLIVLSTVFDLLPLLQYFFTAPVLFFGRLRRKGYGMVYNGIAKTPVDLAVVRLFETTSENVALGKQDRLIQSRVTDKGGRYFFLVQPGTYRITVTKSGFQFPSEYLHGVKTDGNYLDVYHGELIHVTSSDAVITANIPLDPSQADKYHTPSAIARKNSLRKFQHIVAFSGVFSSLIFAAIRPNVLSLLMILIQGVIYLFVRRLATPYKPMNWGIVYDKNTGRPLSQVVARIFEPKYNKLLETQVTDSRGRYAFLLGPNLYYAVFQKSGFKKTEVNPIDYSHSPEPKSFSEKVSLETENA
ncbi:fibronectin type III domain-containing protein [Candidatus Uhrbacteria bacterium]|nr:fibronectin type III domain-containing protein [Candidatus Uhrbacteria bacterium]